MKKDSPNQKVRKCKQGISKLLNKHDCGIMATPIVSVREDGNLNVSSEVKIVPLIKPMIKPKRSKYIN